MVLEVQGESYARENVHTKWRTKCAAIFPDAKLLVVWETEQVRILNISSGEQVRATCAFGCGGELDRLQFDRPSESSE